MKRLVATSLLLAAFILKICSIKSATTSPTTVPLLIMEPQATWVNASQPMTNQSPDRSNVSCNQSQLDSFAGGCGSFLFRPKTAGQTCRSQIPTYVDCMEAVGKRCYADGSDLAAAAKEALQYVRYNETVIKMACDNGGVPRKPPAYMIPVCNSNKTVFEASFNDCVKPFHDAFSQNKGDPRLCQLRGDLAFCYARVLKVDCGLSESVINSSGYNTYSIDEKGNPFCSPSQGGSDPDAIFGPSGGSGGGNAQQNPPLALLVFLAVAVVAAPWNRLM